MTNPAPRYYRLALFFAVAFTVAHVIALPVGMTYDGGQYVTLAMVFGRQFPAGWNFARNPLYPLALRVFFWGLGRHAAAAVLLNSLFGFVGVWSLGAALRRLGSARLAAACLVVLTVYPTLITYEHMVLTEAGSFFFLALLANALTWQPARSGWKTGAITMVAIAGFYFRATLLAMAPLAAILLGLELISRHRRSTPAPRWRATLRVVAPHVAIAALAPTVAAIPWNMAVARSPHHNYNGQNLLYGLVKQAVLPPSDPLVSGVKDTYKAAIADASAGGHLDVGGLRRATHLPVFTAIEPRSDEASAIFRKSVRRYPGRYLAGVGRGLLLYAGVHSIDSETETYVHGVIGEARTGSKLWFGEPWNTPEFVAAFSQPGRNTALAKLVELLVAPFTMMVSIGALVTLAGFAIGCWRHDLGLLTFTGLPLWWMIVHALTLMSSDRLVAPAHAFLVLNAPVLPFYVAKHRARLFGVSPRLKVNATTAVAGEAPTR